MSKGENQTIQEKKEQKKFNDKNEIEEYGKEHTLKN